MRTSFFSDKPTLTTVASTFYCEWKQYSRWENRHGGRYCGLPIDGLPDDAIPCQWPAEDHASICAVFFDDLLDHLYVLLNQSALIKS